MALIKSMLAGLLLPILFVLSGCAGMVTITTQEAGKELQLPGILHKPSGNGPFPAVVMLSGCGGYAGDADRKHYSSWAERLVGWGYVALQVDSFSPRGYPQGVCFDTDRVNNFARSHDAYSAKAYLSTLPFVDPKNIAVIGWSHGGWTIMTIIDEYYRSDNVSPFKAAVAFYPAGHSVHEPNAPLLVLIGMNDDWPGPAGCSELKKSYKNTKYELAMTIYPNVYHAFDYEEYRGGVNYEEHHMEYDPAAASDAISQTRDFLAKYIGGGAKIPLGSIRTSTTPALLTRPQPANGAESPCGCGGTVNE